MSGGRRLRSANCVLLPLGRRCETPPLRRALGDGYELDDDRGRIDLDAVQAFIGGESYWAKGRLATCRGDERQGGEARRLPLRRLCPHGETVERGPFADYRWLLDTTDAHGLYERFGFGRPSERLLERRPA